MVTGSKVVRRIAMKRVGGVPAVVVALAVEALRNPAVQQRLLAAPGLAGRQVQARLLDRHDRALTDGAGTGSSPSKPGAAAGRRERARDRLMRFGQVGLERRSARLRRAIEALPASGRDDAIVADAAAKVLAALDSIDLQLHVAGALPLAKRKRAHFQIGKALDELDAAVWRAVAPD